MIVLCRGPGALMRDLFQQDDGGWLQNLALLDRLVAEKLQAEAENPRAEGWKWIAVANRFSLRSRDRCRSPPRSSATTSFICSNFGATRLQSRRHSRERMLLILARGIANQQREKGRANCKKCRQDERCRR